IEVRRQDGGGDQQAGERSDPNSSPSLHAGPCPPSAGAVELEPVIPVTPRGRRLFLAYRRDRRRGGPNADGRQVAGEGWRRSAGVAPERDERGLGFLDLGGGRRRSAEAG